MSAAALLSKNILLEIFRQFVIADALPSPRALEELAIASGENIDKLRNYYTMTYEAAGNYGDPWTPISPIKSDQR
ncbi:hypothetical protein [Methylobacterium sp. J-067]|uniref:hypothetical protein n=1 Tax=Methylobacterium sp. J-067 TaxID=2836648 RepID=UPI001FBA94AC|nr:hypothetical protein [Methylobacterium sp. J-067]MCJ2023618.1 hypothetical protein [Methylobacterium sp. J-067]